MVSLWFPFFGVVAISASGAYLLIRTSSRTGLLDFPDGIRKRHTTPTPTGGGIAIAVAFFTGIAWLELPLSAFLIASAAGATMVLLMGLVDDRYRLSAPTKLSVQVLATAIPLIPFSTVLNETLPRIFALLLLMGLFILSITNGYNLIDGVDGLSASTAILSASLLIWFQAVFGLQKDLAIHLLATLLALSVLGFLPFNLFPARLFLGDSGSHFVGFMLGCLWLPFAATSHLGAVAAVSANILPVSDVWYSVWRRARIGRSIFQPDREHIHFRATERFQNPTIVTLLFLLATLLTFVVFTYLKTVIGE